MTREELYEALTDVDSEYILSSAPDPARSRRLRLQRWTALAACICLILSLLGIRNGKTVYSAYDMAPLFPAVNDGGTQNYTKVYAPNAEGLYLNTDRVPNNLKVYRYTGSGKGLDEKEFRHFAEKYIPKLAQLFGFSVTEYEIELDEGIYGDDDALRIVQYNKVNGDHAYSLGATQYDGIHRVNIFSFSEHQLLLNGEAIQIDQRNSDEQILSSLSDVKKTLAQTLGVSFSDAKVVRSYDDYNEHGVNFLSVYFYNEKEHALNRYLEDPVSDYIRVDFDNHQAGREEQRSETFLIADSVEYIRLRSNPTRAYATDGKVKALSIREAEELLSRGYVFGNHQCRLCMESQEAVSFEDYDYVSMTYLYGFGYWTPMMDALIIPFYAFYKEIGVGNNGNIIYARTYVPAIALEDMEEYFAEQQEKHR